MGFRDWLSWRRTEKREISLEKFRGLGLLDAPTAAGVVVTESNALTFPAYWSGVNLISNAIAKLPRKVYRKTEEGDREEQPDHPVSWLVHVEPNPYSVPLVFWRTLMGHVLTWGNGYAEIERDRANRPVGLWIIQPDRIEPVVEGGTLYYRYQAAKRLAPSDVLHVPGLGFDGIKGYSVVQMAKQSLGLGMAAERYGATFFGNGAMPGMTLEHPGQLGEAAQQRLRESWNAMHQGPDRAHRLAILEEGMKANPLSIPAKDAQLIETREVQVLDVARWLNINPAMLGYKTAERPGGNYEAGRLDFLDNTLDPWLVAVEQECNRKLISSTQRGTYYVEHSRNAVLRTDAKTRAEVQKMYVDMGALDAAYVAKMENFPKPEPIPQPPPDSSADTEEPPDDEPDEDDSLRRRRKPEGAGPDRDYGCDSRVAVRYERFLQRAAWRRLVVDVVHRMTRLESERARRAAGQGSEKFQAWIDEFYPAHEVRLREALEPVVRGWCEVRGQDHWQALLGSVVAALVVRNREELLEAKSSVLAADVEARVSRWERERPDEAADMVLEGA
jgi:HK97 family phage portal protein